MSRLGSVRDDLQAELDLDEAREEREPFEPPCDRPPGFDGPLQCLAYDLNDRWMTAAHASRENFVDPDGEGGPNSIMHNKFFVVDVRWVWTGSSNISDSGTGGYNANVVAVIDSPLLASIYTTEFEQMWSGQFHTLKESDGVERLSIGGTEASVWFSPQDDAMRFGVEALIARAENRIDIAVFYLTNKYVTADLIAAHNRGVAVRVIVDATSAKNGYSKHELLREAGIPVKVENWGGKMHMKAAVIDGQTIVVGSMNWTNAGENINDENTLILRSEGLASEFESFFNHLWGSIPQEWSELGARPDPESSWSSTACTDGVDNDFDGLADGDDPGCGDDAPELPALPPHWVFFKSEGPLPAGYRLYEGSICDPAYPDAGVCIPPASRGDLDCSDISYRSFTVLDPDPHRFDAAGDGVGCEG